MSVHEDPPGSGIFKVRYRQGGRNRSKSFNADKLGGRRAAEREARRFDVQVNVARAAGDIEVLDRGKVLFGDFVDEWWELYASRRLARRTKESYAIQLDLRIVPRWGGWMLREITPKAIEEWLAELHDQGVGDPTILRCVAILSGVMKRAVVAGHLTANPVSAVDKPQQKRTRKPRALTPEQVERIRAELLRQGFVGDATLVSFLAYAGPRPESEGVTADWANIRKRTVVLVATKKHGLERPVGLLEPLAEDLAEWRRHGDVVPMAGAIFPFGNNGVQLGGKEEWSDADWDNWRDRRFRPAAIAAGLPADTRPRDLRGSFATLKIYAGNPVTKVAEELGNSAAVCLRDYAGVFDEYDPSDRIDEETWIRRARAEVFGDAEGATGS
ncbi:MAG TPA: hypothetical protein VFZ00_28435 [Solirubrobacter sp.]|nr:hypothetical protein [Solirubrobacter sp.]